MFNSQEFIMKKVFIPFCFVALAAISCGSESISFGDLPSTAQVFIKEFFSNLDISFAERESDGYEVNLGNKVSIDFDSRGRWESIKGNMPLPVGILPLLAQEYLEDEYESVSIIEIDKGYSGYEVKLNNGIEILFATNGAFIRTEVD
jgi:hypothetical protein